MFASPARCCLVVYRHHAGLPVRKTNLVQAVTGYSRRNKHDKQEKGGSCCKDVAQTEGKRVEPWPTSDPPPPAWRCQCPTDPQPPNYDPYRIKVPDCVVPPLPPSNAKPVVLTTGHQGEQHPQHQPGYQPTQPPYGYHQQGCPEAKEEEGEGFLGMIKRWFGRGKSKDESKGPGEHMMAKHHWHYVQN